MIGPCKIFVFGRSFLVRSVPSTQMYSALIAMLLLLLLTVSKGSRAQPGLWARLDRGRDSNHKRMQLNSEQAKAGETARRSLLCQRERFLSAQRRLGERNRVVRPEQRHLKYGFAAKHGPVFPPG